MIKSKIIEDENGLKQRVIDGWRKHERLYVFHQTSMRPHTYYVTKRAWNVGVADIVEVNGEYHFETLDQLHAALNAGG